MQHSLVFFGVCEGLLGGRGGFASRGEENVILGHVAVSVTCRAKTVIGLVHRVHSSAAVFCNYVA